METRTDRRDVLRAAGLAAAMGVMGGGAAAAGAAPVPGKRRALSLAHLTDCHVQPERRGAEGLAACLSHLMGLKQRPDMIVMGGDLIMDAFEADEARTRLQWDLFTKTMRDGTNLPVHYCLGNHDIWGWNKTRSGTSGSERGWGKAWAVELLGMPGPYYAFERGNWKIIVLDTVQPAGEGYVGGLDPAGGGAQMAWLQEQLRSTNPETPVCIVSHIPIISGGVLLTSGTPGAEGTRVGASVQVMEYHALADLFARHPNVKLCLSGHLHINDRVDFQGVTYLCNGAVSGAWWMGKEADYRARLGRAKPGDPARPYRSDEGYALVDLFSDGSFAYVYMKYGWKAEG